ncbi:5913_t:CDS:2 [Funneliformis mosseae]|uniref:5913_t:CDS:1 n=1 Tax=Funneliformis mosseae TaxID=27381 RepID=A0A9N9C587_FUNMO|nr:5913_t:CDS:2 [Funneliformis mosseae]
MGATALNVNTLCALQKELAMYCTSFKRKQPNRIHEMACFAFTEFPTESSP